MSKDGYTGHRELINTFFVSRAERRINLFGGSKRPSVLRLIRKKRSWPVRQADMFSRARLSRVTGPRRVPRAHIPRPVFTVSRPCWKPPRPPFTIVEPISVAHGVATWKIDSLVGWKNRARVFARSNSTHTHTRSWRAWKTKKGRKERDTNDRGTTAGLRFSDPSDPMISVCVSWTHFSDTGRKKLIADVWWIVTRTPWTESYSVFPRSSLLPAAASHPVPHPLRELADLSYAAEQPEEQRHQRWWMRERASRDARCVLSPVSSLLGFRPPRDQKGSWPFLPECDLQLSVTCFLHWNWNDCKLRRRILSDIYSQFPRPRFTSCVKFDFECTEFTYRYLF